ncbi:Transmembrane protein 45B [Trichinella pseudospiralis]
MTESRAEKGQKMTRANENQRSTMILLRGLLLGYVDRPIRRAAPVWRHGHVRHKQWTKMVDTSHATAFFFFFKLKRDVVTSGIIGALGNSPTRKPIGLLEPPL